MNCDLLIKGGTIHNDRHSFTGDIAVTGEKITALAESGELQNINAKTVIDAAGADVIPGCLDVHVHLDLDCGEGLVTCDDYASGTKAAACSCVTAVIDFATPVSEQSLAETHDTWQQKAARKAYVDYAWHMSITREEHLAEIPVMIDMGIPTFKQYMIYRDRGLYSNDALIFSALELMKKHGGMLLLHAESQDVLDLLVKREHTPEKMRKHGAWLHAVTRPDYIEAEAIERAVRWCSVTGGSLYIVHVSSAAGVELIRRAKQHDINVRGETCTHFLVLTEDVFKNRDGHLFATCPQVKKETDRARLWQALADSDLQVVSTDTCSFTRQQKNKWGGDFTRIPMGLPGLDTLIPLMYTLGVKQGRISINKMVELCSTRPAELVGLAGQKGRIAPGHDADIVIIDPAFIKSVDYHDLQSRCDWNPYQGMELGGFARTTILRGNVIVDNYKLADSEPRGKWLKRSL